MVVIFSTRTEINAKEVQVLRKSTVPMIMVNVKVMENVVEGYKAEQIYRTDFHC